MQLPERPNNLSKSAEWLWKNVCVSCWSEDPPTRPDAQTITRIIREYEDDADADAVGEIMCTTPYTEDAARYLSVCITVGLSVLVSVVALACGIQRAI